MLLRHTSQATGQMVTGKGQNPSFAIKITRKDRVVGRIETPMLIGLPANSKRAMTARTYLTAVAFLLSGATLAASAATGEFGNECVMGLALGKDIATDCSVNTVLKGRTYCFGNEQAKSIFLKKPEEFLTKAQIYYSSKGL